MTNVQDVFGSKKFPYRKEYRDLFALILDAKEQYQGEVLAEHFSSIIEAYKTQQLDIGNFPAAENHQYTRSYIGQDISGWESIICRWDEGAISSIHGHPDVVFYYVLEGAIEMPFYEKNEDGDMILTRTQILEKGDYAFSSIPGSNFENMIHQVKALKPSLSLHIFSDDALKGKVYRG